MKPVMTLSVEERSNMPEPTTLLEGMQLILDYAEDSALCDEYYENVKVPMEYLCRRLRLTPVQATFLAIIMEKSYQWRVGINHLSQFLGIKNLDMLSHSSDLAELVNRRFIVATGNGQETNYSVMPDVYKAFCQNECYEHKVPVCRNGKELVSYIDYLFCELDDSRRCNKNLEQFDRDIHDLLKLNSSLSLAKAFLSREHRLNKNEFRMLILMSVLWVRNEEVEVEGSRMSIVVDNDLEMRHLQSRIRTGRSYLVKNNLLREAGAENVFGDGSFSLTPQFRKELTPNRPVSEETTEEDARMSKLVRHSSIENKELFYNDSVESQIERLGQLLQEEQMKGVLSRMKEQGLRSGFTCLFYGGPGTGKTETVLQLARATGRNIYQVDISQLRSKWYGDSEKRVKAVFDEYRDLVKRSKVTPILFFNEADAIFTRRMDNATRSVDKGENALQNIILQEMETLEGILIATTNLQRSLDSAFERRFLYKVHIDKPTPKVKARIWKNMIPVLTDIEAEELAEQFDFSGGQIENVKRKSVIDKILTGEETSYESVVALCECEQFDQKRPSIGFVH